MDDGWPQTAGCPNDPAMAELWGAALAEIPRSPAHLIAYLKAGGKLDGALAEALALSLECGQLILSHPPKRKGPSPQTRHEKRRRRYSIGAYIYVRSKYHSLSPSRIAVDASKIFGEKLDQCDRCYKEFKREIENDPEMLNGWDARVALIRADADLADELGLVGNPASSES